MNSDELNVTLPLNALIAEEAYISKNSDSAKGNGPWPGPYRGNKHGQGLDFDELRQYMPGDDTRHIDWKVTARRNEPYTRLYREEKERLLTLALDFRTPMFTGIKSLRAVSAGLLAARLIWQATQLGTRCNLLIQTDKHLHSLPPASGTTNALNACQLIASSFEQAKADRDDKSTQDMTPLLDKLLSNGRFTGSVIFISAGDTLGSEFDSLMAVLGRATDMAWVQIEDNIEWQTLPNGQYGYRINNKNQHIRINQKTASHLNQLLEKEKTSFFNRLIKTGAKPISSREGIDTIPHQLRQWQILA
jgi:hypothetical protein